MGRYIGLGQYIDLLDGLNCMRSTQSGLPNSLSRLKLVAVVWGGLGSVSHYPGYPWESLLLTIQWVELGTGDGMEYWTGPVHETCWTAGTVWRLQ